jgi:hypothetical protein
MKRRCGICAIGVVIAAMAGPQEPSVVTALAGQTAPSRPALDCGGNGGSVRAIDVVVRERGTQRRLPGRLLAPDASRQTQPCPTIAMLPGGGAGIASVAWAAERLSANGYVVLITLPASGASLDAYHVAAVSGIDFLASAENPYRRHSDPERVGVAGWSLGARALTRTQAEDSRVDALVAWDNLAISEFGDGGSPACRNEPRAIRIPRVPAMGQASESCRGSSAEAKLTAFEHWRRAGVPVMQVVFAGATHFWWSARATSAQFDLSHAYTLAWFDRWLKQDPTATDRLLASTVPGPARGSVQTVLSRRFRSAAALDGRTCVDLRTGC